MRIETLKNECTACGACVSACPKKCIEFIVDDEGFYFPNIDNKNCIKCGKCEKICHCLNRSDIAVEKHSYYGFSTNKVVRNSSTSGGAFTALANNVLSNGGNVYGAAFDYDSLVLKHTSTDDVLLNELLKSKYIESCMGDTIARINQDIQSGRQVLFCGTPCQAAGVRRAIGENELLLICDFFCHGVPSTGIFKDYIQQRLHKNEKIINLDFRPKEYGWSGKNLKIITNQKTSVVPYYLDIFYKGFIIDNAFLRRSCYSCMYRQAHHSDVTIADFWGYRELDPSLNDEKGISLIVANNQKGKQAVEMLSSFEFQSIDNRYSDYAYSNKDYSENLETRNQFFVLKKEFGFKKAALKTYMKKHYRNLIKYKLKKILVKR